MFSHFSLSVVIVCACNSFWQQQNDQKIYIRREEQKKITIPFNKIKLHYGIIMVLSVTHSSTYRHTHICIVAYTILTYSLSLFLPCFLLFCLTFRKILTPLWYGLNEFIMIYDLSVCVCHGVPTYMQTHTQTHQYKIFPLTKYKLRRTSLHFQFSFWYCVHFFILSCYWCCCYSLELISAFPKLLPTTNMRFYFRVIFSRRRFFPLLTLASHALLRFYLDDEVMVM